MIVVFSTSMENFALIIPIQELITFLSQKVLYLVLYIINFEIFFKCRLKQSFLILLGFEGKFRSDFGTLLIHHKLKHSCMKYSQGNTRISED